MPDFYLCSIEPLIAIILGYGHAVATLALPLLLSLPSLGVSSLDLAACGNAGGLSFYCDDLGHSQASALRKSGYRWQVEGGGLIHCGCHGSLVLYHGQARYERTHPCRELGGGRSL
jgi:hypothetical protein